MPLRRHHIGKSRLARGKHQLIPRDGSSVGRDLKRSDPATTTSHNQDTGTFASIFTYVDVSSIARSPQGSMSCFSRRDAQFVDAPSASVSGLGVRPGAISALSQSRGLVIDEP